MLKKMSLLAAGVMMAVVLCGCEYMRTHTPKQVLSGEMLDSAGKWYEETCSDCVASAEAKREAKYTQAAVEHTPVVVCRSQQCAPARLSMTREYVYNALLQLLDNNNYSTALICRADDRTHTCLDEYVTLPVKVGIVPTNVYIDSVKITDVIVDKRQDLLRLILNYNLTYGGQAASCTPSQSILFVRDLDHILLEDSQYNCKMTTIGSSHIKSVFVVDYVDLDYGYIGGYYSIGLSGPAYGGGSGYMLLRFGKNAYPLAPVLQNPQAQGGSYAERSSAVNGGSTNRRSASAGVLAHSGVQIFPLNKK